MKRAVYVNNSASLPDSNFRNGFAHNGGTDIPLSKKGINFGESIKVGAKCLRIIWLLYVNDVPCDFERKPKLLTYN
ncbi:hypothetical protein D3C77_531530 [compost metagenome]